VAQQAQRETMARQYLFGSVLEHHSSWPKILPLCPTPKMHVAPSAVEGLAAGRAGRLAQPAPTG
jgi:hypothetical protein